MKTSVVESRSERWLILEGKLFASVGQSRFWILPLEPWKLSPSAPCTKLSTLESRRLSERKLERTATRVVDVLFGEQLPRIC